MVGKAAWLIINHASYFKLMFWFHIWMTKTSLNEYFKSNNLKHITIIFSKKKPRTYLGNVLIPILIFPPLFRTNPCILPIIWPLSLFISVFLQPYHVVHPGAFRVRWFSFLQILILLLTPRFIFVEADFHTWVKF